MYDVDVHGTEGLRRLARALRAGADEIQQRVVDATEKAAEQLLPRQFAAAARDRLPRRGGLGDEVARTRWSIEAAADRIRIEADGSPYNLVGINAGRLTHPVHGRSDIPWVSQDVQPGWFSDTVDEAEPALVDAGEHALVDLAHDIERRT